MAVTVATAVGDSGVYGGISSSHITAGGSENIMNGGAATAQQRRKDDERW